MWIGLALLLPVFWWPFVVGSQDYKKWESKIAEYKRWLDSVGPTGYRLWLRLDGSRRPYGLYVGEQFYAMDFDRKKEFIEIFSNYLSGHPEKFMLIDIFDSVTQQHIGEYGWDGFKLY
jgi:hypothetical protein